MGHLLLDFRSLKNYSVVLSGLAERKMSHAGNNRNPQEDYMARYVVQDGGTFYVHTLDPSEAEIEPETVYKYPWHVGDFDLVDAQLARVWFLEGFSPQAEFVFV